jgi:putative phosphoribosyl transferase
MFKNRIDAAMQLAEKLKHYKNSNGVVLAIPRGGVPLGKVIAETLDLPLEIVLSKKISHPLHKEYAIGAVSLESRVLNDTIDVPDFYIEKETILLRDLLRQRYNLYCKNKKHYTLTDKTVIIIDDGMATGYTMLSTLELIHEHRPKKIVVAVPVASSSAVKMIATSPYIDELVCIMTPEDFRAVAQYYKEFQQVTDEEVIALLKVPNREKEKI